MAVIKMPSAEERQAARATLEELLDTDILQTRLALGLDWTAVLLAQLVRELRKQDP